MSQKIIRNVQTHQGTVAAVGAANTRQTYVNAPPIATMAPGRAATVGANVVSVQATNRRQTRVT